MEYLKNKVGQFLVTLTQPKESLPGHIDLSFFANPLPPPAPPLPQFESTPKKHRNRKSKQQNHNYTSINSSESDGIVQSFGYFRATFIFNSSSESDGESQQMTCCDYHSTHYITKPPPKISPIPHPQTPTNNNNNNDNKAMNLNNAHLLIPGTSAFEIVIPEEYSATCRLQRKLLIFQKFGIPNWGKFMKKEIMGAMGVGSGKVIKHHDHDHHPKERNVCRIAMNSRILVLLIQIIGRLLIPLHQNDGFKTPRPPPGPGDSEVSKPLDSIVNILFGGFVNWDGQYFLHITTHGYTHENTMAFFPLLPLLIGIPTQLLHDLILHPIISPQALGILLCWIMNNGLFIFTAQTIYKIAKLHKIDSNFEKYVVYLFCFNPASIFFSAFYSESLFSWATFNCIYWIYKRELFRAILFAALSSITRSNGLLNLGIIFAFVMGEVLDLLKNSGYYKYFPTHIVPLLIRKGLYFIPGLCPFILFQIFCQYKFCYIHGPNYNEPDPGFCYSIFSLPYAYIQKRNWDVGFLRYFQFKQIPNFLLAFPTLYIHGAECWGKWIQYRKQVFCPRSKEFRYQYLGDFGLVFHGLFLTLFCFFFVHVQISTRMIFSSCPYLYIFIAKQLRDESKRLVKKETNWLPYYTGICLWFGSYFLLGTIGFSLGYPWT